MKINFKNTNFIKSSLQLEDCPTLYLRRGELLPEIAILGRSNVGKSSLLNYLFDSKNLVKTSKKPGKTETLNFFNCDSKLLFVDLPGYGFALHSDGVKKEWGVHLDDYLKTRQTLQLFLFLLDIRHLPSREDIQMLNFLASQKKPYILVFTKVDKLSPTEAEIQAKKILEELKVFAPYILTSALKHVGRKELIYLIEERLVWEI